MRIVRVITFRGDTIPEDAHAATRYISHEMGQLRRGRDPHVTMTPDHGERYQRCRVSRLYAL